jgi:hypothetical protein
MTYSNTTLLTSAHDEPYLLFHHTARFPRHAVLLYAAGLSARCQECSRSVLSAIRPVCTPGTPPPVPLFNWGITLRQTLNGSDGDESRLLGTARRFALGSCGCTSREEAVFDLPDALRAPWQSRLSRRGWQEQALVVTYPRAARLCAGVFLTY